MSLKNHRMNVSLLGLVQQAISKIQQLVFARHVIKDAKSVMVHLTIALFASQNTLDNILVQGVSLVVLQECMETIVLRIA